MVPPLDPDFDGRSMWPAAFGQLSKEECEHDHAKSVHIKSKILNRKATSFTWVTIGLSDMFGSRFDFAQTSLPARHARCLASIPPSYYLNWDL